MNIHKKTIQAIEQQFNEIKVSETSITKPSIPNTILLNCISCPTLSANEIKILSKPRRKSSTEEDQLPPDQSIAIINKLKKILMIWLDVLERNQQCRKNYDQNPVSKQIFKRYEQIVKQGQKVSSKTEVKQFLSKNGKYIFDDNSSEIEQINKKYNPIFFLNNYENYNPVTTITEDQYLIYYEQVIQSILTMTNLLPKANSGQQQVLKLFRYIENEDLFTKFDNKFNQMLKYNIFEAEKITSQYRNVVEKVYQANNYLRQGIIIIYYMCFIAQNDIQSINRQAYKLIVIKFVTDKEQQVRSVFPKIYQRKINKILIKLESQQKIVKRQIGTKAWYSQQQSSPTKSAQRQQNIHNITAKTQSKQKFNNNVQGMQKQLTFIQQKFDSLQKPLSTQNFKNLYTGLQQLCLRIAQYKSKLISNNLSQRAQEQHIQHIMLEIIPNLEKNIIDSYTTGRSKQKILPKLNQKTLVKEKSQIRKEIFQKEFAKQPIMKQPIQSFNKQQIVKQQVYQERSHKSRVDESIKYRPDYRQIFENSFQIQQSLGQQMTLTLTQQNIVDYLQAIKPESAETLKDRQSLNTPYMNRLLENAQKYNLKAVEINQLKIFQSCTKPSINQDNLFKLVDKPIKVDLITALFNKLSEHAFKLSRTLESIQNDKKLEEDNKNNPMQRNRIMSVYSSLPPNIIQFINIRTNYVKAYLRNISQVIPILDLLVYQLRVQTRVKHDLCSQITQNFLLKSFTGVKQILLYLQSQNYIPNLANKSFYYSHRASQMLKTFFYNPLLDSLLSNFSNNKNYRLSQLFAYCDNAINQCNNADLFIQNFTLQVKNNRRMIINARQFGDIIKPIVEKGLNELKKIRNNLQKILQDQIDFFSYENFKKVIIKVQFYESICEAYLGNKLGELQKTTRTKDQQALQLINKLL